MNMSVVMENTGNKFQYRRGRAGFIRIFDGDMGNRDLLMKRIHCLEEYIHGGLCRFVSLLLFGASRLTSAFGRHGRGRVMAWWRRNDPSADIGFNFFYAMGQELTIRQYIVLILCIKLPRSSPRPHEFPHNHEHPSGAQACRATRHRPRSNRRSGGKSPS